MTKLHRLIRLEDLTLQLPMIRTQLIQRLPERTADFCGEKRLSLSFSSKHVCLQVGEKITPIHQKLDKFYTKLITKKISGGFSTWRLVPLLKAKDFSICSKETLATRFDCRCHWQTNSCFEKRNIYIYIYIYHINPYYIYIALVQLSWCMTSSFRQLKKTLVDQLQPRLWN